MSVCQDKGIEQPLTAEHIPVLTEPLLDIVQLPTEGIMVDATVGHGGHSRQFGRRLGPEGLLVGLDVDAECIRQARSVLSQLACRVLLLRENFG